MRCKVSPTKYEHWFYGKVNALQRNTYQVHFMLILCQWWIKGDKSAPTMTPCESRIYLKSPIKNLCSLLATNQIPLLTSAIVCCRLLLVTWRLPKLHYPFAASRWLSFGQGWAPPAGKQWYCSKYYTKELHNRTLLIEGGNSFPQKISLRRHTVQSCSVE